MSHKKSINVVDARIKFTDFIDEVWKNGNEIIITKNGKPKAKLAQLSFKDYKEFEEKRLENLDNA